MIEYTLKENQNMRHEDIESKIEEIKSLVKVEEAARNARKEIETAVRSNAYIEHLYDEQQFEHLIFLEQVKSNLLLQKILDELKILNKSEPQDTTPIDPKPIIASRGRPKRGNVE